VKPLILQALAECSNVVYVCARVCVQEEEAVLQFHLAQFEFACGGALAAISARQWDHNEDFPQYDGPPCMLTASDCEHLISCLSADVRLEFSADVMSVNYSGDSVTVTIGDGRTFTGDYVVVTVPLGVLKTNSIDFRPPLPSSKQDAIQQLGAGHVEQVILHFSKRFWHAVAGGYLGCFGRVASQAECRARFSVFYDLTPSVRNFEFEHLSNALVGDSFLIAH
jgi:hypothetical protein